MAETNSLEDVHSLICRLGQKPKILVITLQPYSEQFTK